MHESSSGSENVSKVFSWIVDQLTMLAEGFGETLTVERTEIYAQALADIPRDRLSVAFRRALRELTYFPKVAELRNFAVSSTKDEKKVEANAAWEYVNEYLRKWGADRLPIYSGGEVTSPPPLDPRSDYALRRVGGLRALNQVDVDKMPFMYRDFCEAYALAPVAEAMALPLQEQFGEARLLGSVKQFLQDKSMDGSDREPVSSENVATAQRSDESLPQRKPQ